jgi:transposase
MTEEYKWQQETALPSVSKMVTRCYRYALAPSQVEAEAFDRAVAGARRYWNGLVAAQRYAECEIRAGRTASVVAKLDRLLQDKKLTGQAASIARQRAAQDGVTAEDAIRELRWKKAVELGRMVRSREGRALRGIGRRRLATEFALESVERTRKVKGSSLAPAVAYGLAKRFRQCSDLYTRGRRRRPKFKGFRDSIGLQVQIKERNRIPLVGTHLNLVRIAGPAVNRVDVILHRPLPALATIKQMSLVCRNGRYCAVLMIEFEPAPIQSTMTHRIAGIDPGRKLALAMASLDGEDEEVFQPRVGWDKRLLRRLRRLQRKADRQRRVANPECFDVVGRCIPGFRLARHSRAQAATERAMSRIQAHLAAARLDYYHRTANALLERFDVIGVGAWRGRGRAPGCGKARRAQNRKDYSHAISLFVGIVQYKAAERNKLVVETKESGSTRNCERCGQATGPSGLSALKLREWTCLVCQHRQHRDFAAARAHASRAAEMAAGAFPEQPALKCFGANSASVSPIGATKATQLGGVEVPVADEAVTARSASHRSLRCASAAVPVQSLNAPCRSGGTVAQGDRNICLSGPSGQPGSAGRPLAQGAMVSNELRRRATKRAAAETSEWENDKDKITS